MRLFESAMRSIEDALRMSQDVSVRHATLGSLGETIECMADPASDKGSRVNAVTRSPPRT
jgi:hypothetical protein